MLSLVLALTLAGGLGDEVSPPVRPLEDIHGTDNSAPPTPTCPQECADFERQCLASCLKSTPQLPCQENCGSLAKQCRDNCAAEKGTSKDK